MPKMWRVYSGSDGRSHIAELRLAMQPFTDTEGAQGEGTSTQSAAGITFRVSPPGYVLDWHRAPRRQYSISLSGSAEIEVGDGTVVEPAGIRLPKLEIPEAVHKIYPDLSHAHDWEAAIDATSFVSDEVDADLRASGAGDRRIIPRRRVPTAPGRRAQT